MSRVLLDHNFNNRIIRGLLRRKPDLEYVQTQDLGFERTADPDLLEWAWQERRMIVTHDVRTMPGHAYARVGRGQSFAGLIEVNRFAPIGAVIEDLLLMFEAFDDDDWENQIRYAPLR